ncbi:Ribosome biogenesis protein NOP53 like [Verticillium longisporum]|nr:Ribosome biogenesis protein NOP53 like [Verticillium longisporum]
MELNFPEVVVLHESKIKARDEQTKRIREIASEIAERDAFVQALVAQQAEVDSSDEEDDGAGEVVLRRKKLGKSKLPEGDLELVLPDELQDSLRRLRPEGNLLKDRYRSLLVRGKVESRRRIAFHKAPKVKYSEKWSYKDFRL